MNDRELLELAARAAGYEVQIALGGGSWVNDGSRIWPKWNPLHNDGDALRIAVTLKMQIIIHKDWVEILINGIQAASCDSCYASDKCMLETTRRAIVKAAAYTLSAQWAASC